MLAGFRGHSARLIVPLLRSMKLDNAWELTQECRPPLPPSTSNLHLHGAKYTVSQQRTNRTIAYAYVHLIFIYP